MLSFIVPVQSNAGPVNGAVVEAWAASRFANTDLPAENSPPPSGTPDAATVTSTLGGPGQALLTVASPGLYNIRVVSGGVVYWSQENVYPSPTDLVTSFNTRVGAVVLTKADVTGTGLAYSDVGADPAGAALAAQNAAETYADQYAGSTAGTAGKPLAATDSTTTNSRTPTAHASTHASGGTDPITITEAQVTNLTTDLAAKATTTALTAETTARTTADTTLQTNITSEASTRASADTTNATAISTETTRATTAEALLAPKASPALTGTPTAPTASALDASTKIATTAYANNAATSRLKYLVQVTDYGATGDGTTDDYAAITSAIAALRAGGILYFPTGTYVVGTTLSLPSWITVRGAGTIKGGLTSSTGCTIQQKTGANLDAVIASSSWLTSGSTYINSPIHLEHIAIDGNATNQTGGQGNGVALCSYQNHINDVEIHNTLGHGLLISDANRSGVIFTNTQEETHINRLVTRQTGKHGVYVQHYASGQKSTDGFLNDCIIANSGYNWSNPTLSLMDNAVTSLTPYAGVRIESAGGWKISGNHLYALPGSGIEAAGWATKINDNYIETFGYGAVAGTYYGIANGTGTTVLDSSGNVISTALWMTAGEGVVIADNTIRQTSQAEGYTPQSGTTCVGIAHWGQSVAGDYVGVVTGNSVFFSNALSTWVGVRLGMTGSASTTMSVAVAGNNIIGAPTRYTKTAGTGTLNITGDVFGTSLATSLTGGFSRMPGVVGVPSGTPIDTTSGVPVAVDTADSLFYGYIGSSWKPLGLTQASLDALKSPTPPINVQNAIATLFSITPGTPVTFNLGAAGGGAFTYVGNVPTVGDLIVLTVASSGNTGATSGATFAPTSLGGGAWSVVNTETYGSGTTFSHVVTAGDIVGGTYMPIAVNGSNATTLNLVQAIVSEWSNVDFSVGSNGVFYQGHINNSVAASTVSNASIKLAAAATDGVAILGKQTAVSGGSGAVTVEATANSGGAQLIGVKTAPSASTISGFGAAVWTFTGAPTAWTALATLQWNDWTTTGYTTPQSVFPTYAVVSIRGVSVLNDPLKLPLSGGTMTGNIVMSGTSTITGLPAATANGQAVRFEQLPSLAAADASVVVGGTAVAPTVRTATLDVIATQHPPTNPVPMNGQKLTGLPAGTTAGDSVRFEQLPATSPTPPLNVQNAIATLTNFNPGTPVTFNLGSTGTIHTGSVPSPGDLIILTIGSSGDTAATSGATFSPTSSGTNAWNVVHAETYGSGTTFSHVVTAGDIVGGVMPIVVDGSGATTFANVQAIVSEWSNVDTSAGTNGVFYQGVVTNASAVSTISNTSIRLAAAATDGVVVMGKQTAAAGLGAATVEATANSGGAQLIPVKTAPNTSVTAGLGAAIWAFTNAPSSWIALATLQWNDWTTTGYSTPQSVFPTYAVLSIRGVSALNDPLKLPLSGGTMSGVIVMGGSKVTGLSTSPSTSGDAIAYGASAGGDLTGTYPNPTLGAVGSASGPIGSASVTPVVTTDSKGRVTALTSATITPAAIGALGSTAAAGGDLTGNYPNPTLAAAGTAGTYTKVTTDSKGRVTSGTNIDPSWALLTASNASWPIPAGATQLEIICVGGGGAGGGGIVSAGAAASGGAGGGAGAVGRAVVAVGANTTLAVVIAAGGTGVAGAGGNNGGQTSVTGTGIGVYAAGGSNGTAGAAGAQSAGGFAGRTLNTSIFANSTPGGGGSGNSNGNGSGSGGVTEYGGAGGAGGGGTAGTTGGAAGGAGFDSSSNTSGGYAAGGAANGSGAATGATGTSAASNTGAGGGGAGSSGTGGSTTAGGAGGSGKVYIRVVA